MVSPLLASSHAPTLSEAADFYATLLPSPSVSPSSGVSATSSLDNEVSDSGGEMVISEESIPPNLNLTMSANSSARVGSILNQMLEATNVPDGDQEVTMNSNMHSHRYENNSSPRPLPTSSNSRHHMNLDSNMNVDIGSPAGSPPPSCLPPRVRDFPNFDQRFRNRTGLNLGHSPSSSILNNHSDSRITNSTNLPLSSNGSGVSRLALSENRTPSPSMDPFSIDSVNFINRTSRVALANNHTNDPSISSGRANSDLDSNTPLNWRGSTLRNLASSHGTPHSVARRVFIARHLAREHQERRSMERGAARPGRGSGVHSRIEQEREMLRNWMEQLDDDEMHHTSLNANDVFNDETTNEQNDSVDIDGNNIELNSTELSQEVLSEAQPVETQPPQRCTRSMLRRMNADNVNVEPAVSTASQQEEHIQPISSQSRSSIVRAVRRRRGTRDEHPATRSSRKRGAPRNPSSGRDNSAKRQACSTPSSTSTDNVINLKSPPSPPPSLKISSNHLKNITTDSNIKHCCICLEEPSVNELSKLNGCKHTYCFGCIEKWSERENTCPQCKERFSKIERVVKQVSRKKKASGKGGNASNGTTTSVKNVKRVRNRDQRADFGQGATALQSIIANMTDPGAMPNSIAQLIFNGMGIFAPHALQSNNNSSPSLARPTGRSSSRPNTRMQSAVASAAMAAYRQHNSDGMPLRSTMPNTFSSRHGNRQLESLVASRTRDHQSRIRANDILSIDDNEHSLLEDATILGSGLEGSDQDRHLNSPLRSAIRPSRYDNNGVDVRPVTRSVSDLVGITDDIESEDEDYGSFVQRVRNLRRERQSALATFQFSAPAISSRPFSSGSMGYELVNNADLMSHVDTMDLIHGDSNPVAAMNVSQHHRLHHQNHFPLAMPPRSFAMNGHEEEAGSFQTPLEIMDSDEDDDDDVVEVLAVGDR